MGTDRQIEKDILVFFEAKYPDFINGDQYLYDLHERVETDYINAFISRGNWENNVVRELTYLVEHRLLDSRKTAIGRKYSDYRITVLGIDFLANDGGLSAILNTVTVKFDAENIRALMEEGLLKANIPQENKDGILAKLRTLPGKALETVTLELIKKALANPAEALSVIRSALGPMGISF